MPKHKLREQVRSELKIRRYIVYTLLLLSILYASANLVLGDIGIVRYIELKNRKTALEKETAEILKRKAALMNSITAYKGNNFYREKNARENFGLAGTDEYIFMYRGGRTSPKDRY